MIKSAVDAVKSAIGVSDPQDDDTSNNELPNIYFIIDTTGSMSSYISSLNQVLDQIFTMVRILFSGKVNLHVISYKDYCDDKFPVYSCHNTDEIQTWVRSNLRATGGGDSPEAAKTALNELFHHLTSTKKNLSQTLVLVYTDAPPHAVSGSGSTPDNVKKEKAYISQNYPSPANPGFDWISICKGFKQLNIPFLTFLVRSSATTKWWKLLGEVITMPNTNQDTITKATIGALSQLMACCDDTFIETHAPQFKVISYAEPIEDYDSLESESNCKGYLGTAKMVDSDFMSLDSFAWLSESVSNLPKKLLSSEPFRDLVFREFKGIFTVTNIVCLSYNSLFGTIWRHLCRFREDDRLKVLKNTFSLLMTELQGTAKEEMSAWLEDSYDDTEEINALIRSYLDADQPTEEKNQQETTMIEYITLDAVNESSLPTKKELLSISHSLFGDIIQKVQSIMTHLISVRLPVHEDAPFDSIKNTFSAIPSGMQDKPFFALLSHLVVPGTRFTLRPSLIMAMIAYLSGNSLLKTRAYNLLMKYKSNWIQLDKLEDFPEFVSVPFAKLVIRCHRLSAEQESSDNSSILSDEEVVFYERLYAIYRVRMTRAKEFEVQIAFVPKLKDATLDTKRECVTCKQWRSFTLLLEGDTCAKCVQKELEPEAEIKFDEGGDLSDKKTESHLVSCRTCAGIYAVVDVNALNVSPKCHYCRMIGLESAKKDKDESKSVGSVAPTVECAVCWNKWVVPSGKVGGGVSNEGWVCSCCVKSPERALVAEKVSFQTLAGLYDELLGTLFGVCVKNKVLVSDLFSTMSLYKLHQKHGSILMDESGVDDEKCSRADVVCRALVEKKMSYQLRKVHNVKGLVDNIVSVVSRGKLSDICCLCFDEKALITLESACGLCKNRLCSECLGTWYGQMKPGALVLPSHLLCPLCKRKPHVKTMKKWNKEMCTLLGGKKRESMVFSGQEYYAWCMGCYQIKPAMKRECLRDAVPMLKGFKCEQCVDKEALEAAAKSGKDAAHVKENYQQCPGCKMATVKVSGCNHITCVCGEHWCYECGEAFDEDVIYDHMEEAHYN